MNAIEEARFAVSPHIVGAKHVRIRVVTLRRIIEQNDALLVALKRSAEGWANAVEMKIILPQHVTSASVLRDEAQAAIHSATKEQT